MDSRGNLKPCTCSTRRMYDWAGVGAIGGRGPRLAAGAGAFAGLAGQNGGVGMPPQMHPPDGFAGMGGGLQMGGGRLPTQMQPPDGSAGMAGIGELHAAYRALGRGGLGGFLASVARAGGEFVPPVQPRSSFTGLPGPHAYGGGGVPGQMQPRGQMAGVQAWRNATNNVE